MSDDSRANRLRERRRQSSDRVETDEPDDPSKPDEPDELDEPSESSEPSARTEGTEQSDSDESTDAAEEASVKDEQIGTYMYLPENQHRRLNHVYNRLKADYEFEFDEDFEKNRHFFPLVVEHGLDTLDGLDADEVRDRLTDL
ncbi:hypothetical protein [Halospeciosus flavus]|uniref:DUF8160 domain-containing protein n=1 Tax=Halospeciosus flavus TaxID=3032283 RepID=A0ABD5Z0Q7_9EURY|nr:hypothetical protein [Halospeciosus flavus]